MRQQRLGFTLLEVLISIMLLSLVLMALYKSADILRDSNLHLFNHVDQASTTLKGSQTLYMDLMHSDSNISINSEEKFHRLSIYNTQHSLYGLSQAHVEWLVYKEDNTLLRVEGGNYQLPLKTEQQAEVDVIGKNMELFKIYPSKDKEKILVLIKKVGQDTQTFMVQNIPLAPLKPNDNNRTNPTGINPPNLVDPTKQQNLQRQ